MKSISKLGRYRIRDFQYLAEFEYSDQVFGRIRILVMFKINLPTSDNIQISSLNVAETSF